MLVGSFGNYEPPAIVSVMASDDDNSAPGFSNGDRITITFNMRLLVRYRNWWNILEDDPNLHQTAGVAGPRMFVQSLFSFSGKLGSDYSGEWTDESVFVVTVTDRTASHGVDVGSMVVRTKKCQA